MNNKKFYTVRGYQLLEQNKKLLTPALEDYLEMIYRISLQGESIRINTLAGFLNVKPSSATKMVQKLSLLNLVDYQKYEVILLTPQGKEIGEFLYNRHRIIETFLTSLNLSKDVRMETELIEHSMSPDTVNNLDLFNQFLEQNPSIVEDFASFRDSKEQKSLRTT